MTTRTVVAVPELDDTCLPTTGIDWLTMTYRDQDARREALARANARISQREAEGFRLKRWSGLGFDGYSAGGVSWGDREDVSMVRLSGGQADEHWKAFSELGGHPTRLDVHTTCTLRRADRTFIQREYERANTLQDTSVLSRRHTLVVSTGGGCTYYLGSRSSRWYGRLYDKGVESGSDEPGRVIRYEVEAKDDAAEQLLAKMETARNYRAVAASFISEWFSERGVTVLWRSSEAIGAMPRKRPNSDRNRSLDWLERQVKPTVQWLLEEGEGNAVREALGLGDW